MDERLAAFIKRSCDSRSSNVLEQIHRAKEMWNVECGISDVEILTSTILHLTFHISVPLLQYSPKSQTPLLAKCVVLTSATYFFGDHTVVVTPVPIPNTVVKHPGPMIVGVPAKVGIANFFPQAARRLSETKPRRDYSRAGFF